MGPEPESRPGKGLAKSLTWFSYLDGTSLRRDCSTSKEDRYRFIYNASFTEQVRTYDLVVPHAGQPGSGSALLMSHVFSYAPLEQAVDAVVDVAQASVWVQRTMPADAVRSVLTALKTSGFGAGAQTAQWLRSDDFFWLVSACEDGRFAIKAWTDLGPDFASVQFARPLLALDETAVPVRKPTAVPLEPFRRAERMARQNDDGPLFRVYLTSTGVQPNWP